MTEQDEPSLTCVTWNVHRGRGARSNGAVDVERVFAALAAEIMPVRPAVLALQEADEEEPPHRGVFDPARIEAIGGLVHAGAPRLRWSGESHGFLGSVFYLRPDIEIADSALIDLPGHAHRGAVLLELRIGDAELRVVTTHLSLLQPIRIAQMRTIGQHLFRRRPMPTVLMGDLNEWRPWGGLAFAPAVAITRWQGPAPATFPVGRPLFALDRILADRSGMIEDVHALDGPLIREASDHRPLAGRLRLQAVRPNHMRENTPSRRTIP